MRAPSPSLAPGPRGERPASTTSNTSSASNPGRNTPEGQGQAPRPEVPVDPKASFPSTLHKMLTQIDEDEGMADLKKIISWQDHGMAFKIHDRQAFIDKIMPLWYSRLKYSSWVRQCNLFGFKRIQMDGQDKGAMYHADNNFIRGMPELAATVTKVKKNRSSQAAASQGLEKEPNFQLMVYQRIGMPFNRLLQRTAMEEAKQAAEPSGASARASPTLASATLSTLQRTTQHSGSDSSLRDMLMPILTDQQGAASAAANTPPTLPQQQQLQNFMGSATPMHTSSGSMDADPFETLWNTLGDTIRSSSAPNMTTHTPHHHERICLGQNSLPPMPLVGHRDSTHSGSATTQSSLSSANTWQSTASTDALNAHLFDLNMEMDVDVGLTKEDVEPLRVFHPAHEHAGMEHESSEEEGKKPTKTARKS